MSTSLCVRSSSDRSPVSSVIDGLTLTGGTITVYDGTTTGGVVLYSKTLAVGDVVHFGGNGIAAKNGLFLVVSAGTVVIMYT